MTDNKTTGSCPKDRLDPAGLEADGSSLLIPVTGVDTVWLGRTVPETLLDHLVSFNILGLVKQGFTRRRSD